VNKDTVNDLGYTATGATQAYVQFQQDVPKGILRLSFWPTDAFQHIIPQPAWTAAPAVTPLPASAREGKTLYVSKLGDNSDGSTWSTAYTTIQAALDAIPDGEGGHQILIRPDTYMEAMLKPAHAGAKGSYNTLDADFDGSLGSGTTGYCILDSSDPAKGLKSVDWWGPFFCTAEESAKDWDRWNLRHIYSTGSEGGMGWDMSAEMGRPFSVTGIVGGFTARPDEPVVYRRCQLWSLDWWGDTAGMYVRAENTAPPERPDVTLEDCTLVSPQCSLKSGNPGFGSYSRVCLKNCRLVTLNFSQPAGTPTDGIIQSVIDGKLLHVDLEDCALMGYKVFGVRKNKDTAKDIGYTLKGDVTAYVQFQQEVPEGFRRLTQWPVDTFNAIVPPMAPDKRPQMTREGPFERDMCEVSPVIWKGRMCLMSCVRPASGGTEKEYYLVLRDVENGAELARFAEGYGLACAFVHNDTFYAFASRFADNNWNDVTMFSSSDLKTWDKKVVITQIASEHLFNSSVCEGPDGFVMVYESNDPAYPAFTTKFAQSKDLGTWEKMPDAMIGANRYTACPAIRHAGDYYYVLYVEHRSPRWFFETYVARSRDLKSWELSPANPVLTPHGVDEGINASDPDLVEVDGKTYLYYAVGDQLTWMNIYRKVYPGTEQAFFESWFTAGYAPLSK
jgi:hypothetical protein